MAPHSDSNFPKLNEAHRVADRKACLIQKIPTARLDFDLELDNVEPGSMDMPFHRPIHPRAAYEIVYDYCRNSGQYWYKRRSPWRNESAAPRPDIGISVDIILQLKA